MAGTVSLDNLVSVSELSHGGVSRALGRVSDNNPVVVMRNNKPAAVVITPADYKRYTEAEENFALYLEATDRMKHDDGTRIGMDDVFSADNKRLMTVSNRSLNRWSGASNSPRLPQRT